MKNPTADSFALNTTTFTAITTERVTVGRDIGVVTSDSSAWIFSDDEAGTKEVTVPAPGSLSFSGRRMDKDGVLFWAKASAGTPSLSLFVGVHINN